MPASQCTALLSRKKVERRINKKPGIDSKQSRESEQRKGERDLVATTIDMPLDEEGKIRTCSISVQQ